MNGIAISKHCVRGGPSYCAEYQAVYDAFSTKPPTAVAFQQNLLVETLIAGGVWAAVDVFTVLATQTGGQPLNWKNIALNIPVLINAPTFVEYEGYTSAGTGSYIDFSWKPSDGVNYQLNNACYGGYIRALSTFSSSDYGCTDGTYYNLAYHDTGSRWVRAYCNGTNYTALTATAAAGLKVVDLVGTTIRYLKNGVEDGTGTRAITGRPTVNTFGLCYNNNGAPAAVTNRQLSLFLAGSAMSNALHLILNNAFKVYMDSNGKGV